MRGEEEVLIKLTAKNPTVEITSKDFKINDFPKRTVNFIKNLEKEVRSLTKKERREKYKKISQTLSVFMSTLATATPVFATNSIVSTELIQLFVTAIGACILIAVLAGTLLLILTGVWQMFDPEKAVEARQNIIKGLIQSLVAPLVVMTIVYLGHLLFSGNSYYIDPFELIPSFKN